MALDKRKKIKLDVADKKKRKFGSKAWQLESSYVLEAWYDASQMVFHGDEDRETKFMQNADHKERRKAYRQVCREIRTLNKYRDVEAKPVRDMNTLMGHARFPVELENLEKIKRVKRRLRVDTKGFLDYVRKRWMTPEERELHGLE
ncbi:hypothetical protein D3C78_1452230 [compost metagenome]